MATDSKIVLTALVFFWTYINIAAPGGSSGTALYVVACILAIFQFHKPGMTKWCIMSLLVGLGADILFPIWVKP